ncbi:MAG: patatin-like phospholipase family protein [Burkholderiales bacterium]|nr:patatin-like phospholipase family protein [Burkholderiales bacterium]
MQALKALSAKQPSKKKALMIGGGAPNASLMAGALVAFIKQGVEFDVISTSGAGAVMGLLYTVPRDATPEEALENWVNVGVADPIYNGFPINYKVFMKPGPQAQMFRDLLDLNPLARQIMNEAGDNRLQRLFSDWMQLAWATVSPSNLTPQSKGLCAHVPWIGQLVDFAKMKDVKPEFYMNAYNVTQHFMQIWGKEDVTLDHFRATLSFPYIYPPYRLGEDEYIEGAAIDTLNFKALVSDDPRHHACARDVDTLVVFDILGSDKLIRPPRDLYDAWVLSIIIPLVEIAKDDVRLFELVHNRNPDGSEKRRLLKVDLMGGIPDDHWPEVLDWSSSNLRLLYKTGFNAGLKFCKEHADALNIDYKASVKPMQLA